VAGQGRAARGAHQDRVLAMCTAQPGRDVNHRRASSRAGKAIAIAHASSCRRHHTADNEETGARSNPCVPPRRERTTTATAAAAATTARPAKVGNESAHTQAIRTTPARRQPGWRARASASNKWSRSSASLNLAESRTRTHPASADSSLLDSSRPAASPRGALNLGPLSNGNSIC
jgi:hypothetical protein